MKVRISAVQYHLHTVDSFHAFAAQVTHYVKTAQEYESDFILFPELFTTSFFPLAMSMGMHYP